MAAFRRTFALLLIAITSACLLSCRTRPPVQKSQTDNLIPITNQWPARDVHWKLSPQAWDKGWRFELCPIGFLSGATATNSDPRSTHRALIYDWANVTIELQSIIRYQNREFLVLAKLENRRSEPIALPLSLDHKGGFTDSGPFLIERPGGWELLFRYQHFVGLGTQIKPNTTIQIEAILPDGEYDDDVRIALVLGRLLSKPATIGDLKRAGATVKPAQ